MTYPSKRRTPDHPLKPMHAEGIYKRPRGRGHSCTILIVPTSSAENVTLRVRS